MKNIKDENEKKNNELLIKIDKLVKEKNDINSSYFSEMKNIKDENEKKNNELLIRIDKYKTIETEYNKLKDLNNSLYNDNDITLKKISKLESEIASLKNEIQKLINENNNDKEIITQKNDEISKLKEEINKLNNKNDNNGEIEIKINEYSVQVEKYQSQTSNLDNENKTYFERIQNYEKKIQKLTDRLNSFENISMTNNKNTDENFCSLYKNFADKILLQKRFHLCLKMIVKKELNELQKKYDQLINNQNNIIPMPHEYISKDDSTPVKTRTNTTISNEEEKMGTGNKKGKKSYSYVNKNDPRNSYFICPNNLESKGKGTIDVEDNKKDESKDDYKNNFDDLPKIRTYLPRGLRRKYKKI